MFERISMVFKAMIQALLGNVENPQFMLDTTYNELQNDLLLIRKKLAKALAAETQLMEKIKALESADAPPGELKEQLEQLQEEIARIRRKLEDLENGVQRTYTKRKVLIARNKASQATLVCEEILVGKAITEDGATFDREIAPDPADGSIDVPRWVLPIVVSLIVVIVIVGLSNLHR